MAIQVKHTKVSTVPDDTDTSLVRPSDWNADHTLVGTIDVPNGGTGASTLTGYVKGNGTSAMTASATIPSGDVTGLGTMSTQNANAVAITGGTINGTTIGATTPSSIVGTTITGQTGVLRGTGNNLVLRSQALTTSPWTLNASPTTASTTDPLGGSTATQFTTSANNSGVYQVPTVGNGITLTWSVYVRYISGDGTLRFGVEANPSTATVVFNSSAGTITSTGASLTATSVTNIGSGWYRVSGTFVSTSTSVAIIVYSNNTNASSFAAWGFQLEVGSVLNAYVATTTTAVYGTPTLSFSGVSTLGLESNGALFLQPAGTGAIQAQATTSTTAGGNARGANAVDWQTSRDTAARVASGSTSFIGSGRNNTSSGQDSFVGAGFTNTASSSQAGVVSGARNTASGPLTFIGAGSDNVASAYGATIVGGQTNTTAGYFNFIGNGSFNSGTSGSAVTTQATTAVTSGSTAVTLSGSNANIRVGQIIAGTGITFPDTYVAAISGTALTLSRTATATGTPTLSFFTPHGVVVGGGNNQATGSYSFIGGGGDGGTAANRNVASGDWSFVGGGTKNTASGLYSSVNGSSNTSSGTASVVAGGGAFGAQGFVGNTASGTSSFIGAGIGNLANSSYAGIMAGTFGTARAIDAIHVFPAINNAFGASANGASQSALLILARQTTDATATALTSNTSAAGTTNQVILPNNSAYLFKATVISGVTGGGNTSAWKLEGAIKRGANAASTTIVGLVTTTLLAQDAGAATWAIAATADTTNGGLRITFTGQASTTIRTVCKVETTEVTF